MYTLNFKEHIKRNKGLYNVLKPLVDEMRKCRGTLEYGLRLFIKPLQNEN